MSLLTLTIIGIIIIVLIFTSHFLGDDWLILEIIGYVSLFVLILVGFIFYATDSKYYFIVKKIPPKEISVIKSNKNVYVEFLDTVLVYKNKVDFDEINDSTTFYVIIYLNHYGFKSHVEITYNKKFEQYVDKEKLLVDGYINE